MPEARSMEAENIEICACAGCRMVAKPCCNALQMTSVCLGSENESIAMPLQLSLPRDRISVLLLEGINQSAVDYFSSCGYTNLVHLPKALDDKDLKSHIADA